MGSYGENTLAATATSAWYQMPPRTPDRPLVVIAAAGAIWSYKEDGDFMYGQSLKLQWGATKPDGSVQPLGLMFPIDIGPQPAWRNLRFPTELGAAGGQRRPHRRLRPQPERGPVVRVHAAAGAGAEDAAAADRVAEAGADGHRHRRELPLPAAVLRTPRRRRAAGLPHPARPQADVGVVEPVAGVASPAGRSCSPRRCCGRRRSRPT